MSTPSTMMIDNVKYVREDSIPTPAGPPSSVQIVVVEGRWNLVGYVEHQPDGSLVITKAAVIRYWGTTKGLGELALNGPTIKTVLDSVGIVRVPSHAVLLCMDSKPELWSL